MNLTKQAVTICTSLGVLHMYSSPALSSKRYLSPGLLNPGFMSNEPSGCALMETSGRSSV